VSTDHPATPTIAARPSVGAFRQTSTRGIANIGSTVIIVRPGNHQPIIVITTNVAMPSCTAIRPPTMRAAPRRCRANTIPGTATSSKGAHRPIPNRRSTKTPQSRYTRSPNER